MAASVGKAAIGGSSSLLLLAALFLTLVTPMSVRCVAARRIDAVSSVTTQAAAQPAPAFPPSAFFAWCRDEKFGVKSPQTGAVSDTSNLDSTGQRRFIKFAAWIPSKTDPEAQKYLETTFAAIWSKTVEKGCELPSTTQADPPPETGFSLKYRSGRIHGVLEGKYECRDVPGMGNSCWLNLKVEEAVAAE